MGIKLFSQNRYSNDKVWTEHTGFTGHQYKTKYMNDGHIKRQKVQDKKVYSIKQKQNKNENLEKEMAMQIHLECQTDKTRGKYI